MYKLLLSLGLAAAVAGQPVIALAQVLALPLVHDGAQSPATSVQPTVLNLDQALELADRVSVDIRQTASNRDALSGDLSDASHLLWNNPKLNAERVRREVPAQGLSTTRQREWSASFEQTFEIAGQQGYRRRAAQAQLAAHGATLDETRRAVLAEVETSFVEVLALQERVKTENASLGLIQNTAQSVEKRVVAGEDSRLDGNLAQVEAVRARNQIGVLQEQLIEARQRLAELLQLPAGALPIADGTLDVGQAKQYSLADLLSRASQRPLLRALDNKQDAARNRLSLERATRYPDVTVAVSTSREGPVGAQERLTGLSMSIPLPLFHQNAGAIGRASTELKQITIERETAVRDSQAAVAALWQRMQSLTERVKALRSSILPTLEQNQELSKKSLQAGEISIVQLLLVNRQLLDGRKDLIDAERELRVTDIALRTAAGLLSRP